MTRDEAKNLFINNNTLILLEQKSSSEIIDQIYDSLSKIIYQEINHGDDKHKKWLFDKLNELLGVYNE